MNILKQIMCFLVKTKHPWLYIVCSIHMIFIVCGVDRPSQTGLRLSQDLSSFYNSVFFFFTGVHLETKEWQ